jgi:hypothetical protein
VSYLRIAKVVLFDDRLETHKKFTEIAFEKGGLFFSKFVEL